MINFANWALKAKQADTERSGFHGIISRSHASCGMIDDFIPFGHCSGCARTRMFVYMWSLTHPPRSDVCGS
jgi:hypothetical protein